MAEPTSESKTHDQKPATPDFTRYVNLADPRLGAKAIFATDEFFASKERMLNPDPAVFVPGKYDDHGKWMDGWETRRKRSLGHNVCVVQLARPGVIHGVDIDTSFFTGNFPPAASLDACYSPKGDPDWAADVKGEGEVTTGQKGAQELTNSQKGDPQLTTGWVQVLPSTTLKGNKHHVIKVDAGDKIFTHVRLNIYPDGGVARLRVYCQPKFHRQNRLNPSDRINLVAMENGGFAVAANDQHYGHPSNLLLPGRGINMGEGWETRRRREPGNDWCIIALGQPGEVEEIEVDTAHFKGNFPDRCSIQAAYVTGGTLDSLITQSMFWPTLMHEQKLQMDKQHFFKDVQKLGPITHVRFNIIPDGGVSRLRLFGRLADMMKMKQQG